MDEVGRRADLRGGRRGGRDHEAQLPPDPRRPRLEDASAAQRERLAPLIRGRAVAVGVGRASVTEIDRLNIYHATHLAMRRAIARVGEHEHVLVDGNRIAGFEAQVGPYSAIVKGDAKVYSIACASVVAKVVRDRMMTLLAARYPGYGWERNQGYATLEHRMAIRELGLTPFHRRSFLALQRTLAGDQLGLFDDPEALSDALSANWRTTSRRSSSRSWPTASIDLVGSGLVKPAAIIDCDPGHDDVMAILLAGRTLDLQAITTVHGNASLANTTTNARKTVEFAGLTDIPIAAGMPRPLVREPHYAPEVHGECGLDGPTTPVTDGRDPRPERRRPHHRAVARRRGPAPRPGRAR